MKLQKKFWPVLAIALFSLPSFAEDCKSAQALIQKITGPQISGTIYRDFSISAKIIVKKSMEELESAFWKNTYYSRMSDELVNYSLVEAAALKDGDIETFRVRNAMASEYFISRYASTQEAVALRAALPRYAVLGTGYVDKLSDAFGDQFFAFQCSDMTYLSVEISHAYN